MAAGGGALSMVARVLHVIPSIADRYGGPSAAVLGMSRALIAAGTPVVVATTDADGPQRLAQPLGRVADYRGVPTIMFRRQWSEAYKWSPALASWLRGQVRAFDVVHVHAVFSHASIAAGRACRAAHVPYIVRPLGTLDPWSLDRRAWRKRALLALGARRLLRSASAIHYTTAVEQQLAEERLPFLRHGVVAPLGVDDKLFTQLPAPTRERTVLALSRLDVKKGFDLLIEAFHAATADNALADWRLVVAGDGDPAHVAFLQELAGRGPARDRISFAGWVDSTARAVALGSASLFALPSHQENFGVAIVEAMAAGVPVVLTPGVNLAADIQSAGAGWVTEQTPDALAATLRLAMTDAAERLRRGDNARRFAEQFRWPHVAIRLQQLYEDVSGGRLDHSAPALLPVQPA